MKLEQIISDLEAASGKFGLQYSELLALAPLYVVKTQSQYLGDIFWKYIPVLEKDGIFPPHGGHVSELFADYDELQNRTAFKARNGKRYDSLNTWMQHLFLSRHVEYSVIILYLDKTCSRFLNESYCSELLLQLQSCKDKCLILLAAAPDMTEKLTALLDKRCFYEVLDCRMESAEDYIEYSFSVLDSCNLPYDKRKLTSVLEAFFQANDTEFQSLDLMLKALLWHLGTAADNQQSVTRQITNFLQSDAAARYLSKTQTQVKLGFGAADEQQS